MQPLEINPFDDVASPATTDLSKVTNLAQKLIQTDLKIEAKEKELVALKEERFRIATLDLPELMASVNLSDCGISHGMFAGFRIEVEPMLTARLPSKESIEKAKGDDKELLIQRRENAFGWLRSHKAGDLIKYEVKIAFDKGKPIQGLLNMLKRWKGIAVKHDENVHFKTLEKYVGEQVRNGVDIPFDIFGVWTGKMAKIIPPAKK